jgi:DNA-binding MurR/RpiR family transcriptional regulator
LALQLGPARDRIRQRPPSDLFGQVLAAEQDNVTNTLQALHEGALERTAGRLSDARRRVWVLPGTVTSPIGQVLANHLGQLRDGVILVAGSEMAVSRGLAGLQPGDTLVAIDIHRYERMVLSTVSAVQDRGADVVAITDSPLSPLAANAADTFLISARGVGPFDSMTGGIALANLLVAEVASQLRETATSRLDAIEAAWRRSHALVIDAEG